MYTLIKNAVLASPGLLLEPASILISGDTVIRVAQGDIPAPAGAAVIDAAGALTVPGFIDVHCHGRNNSDFCDGTVADAQKIINHKLEEGVTSLLPTTLTMSREALKEALAAVAACDRNTGCRIPGVHLEGPFINIKCAGAQNPDFVRLPDAAEVEELHKIYPVAKITFAVEQPGGAEFTSAMLAMGIVPSCTHSAAKYAEFQTAYEAGLRNLSHFCNQMTPLHHRDIGLVGAGLLHDEVFCELIGDKLHISPEMIKLVFKIKGAGKVVLISDAMRASGMPDGDYTLGGLPVVVSGGAARLKNGGALAGSTLQLATALKNITEVTGLPLSETVKASSWSAAQSLKWTGLGRIEPGYLADIVLLNREFQVLKTMVGGQIRYER